MTFARRSMARSAICGLAAFCLLATSASAGFIKWQQCSNGLDLGAGRGVMEVSAGGKDVVWAISDGAGLFKSTDGGVNWIMVKADELAAPYAIAAAPDDGNVVYVANKAGGGIFKSTDGVKFAKCADKAKGLASDDVEWITVAPDDAKVVLVGHKAGKAISVSADAGATWSTKEMPGEVKGQIIIALSSTKWAVASRVGSREPMKEDPGSHGIYATTDSGTTWATAEGDVDYFSGSIPMIGTGDYLITTKHHGFNRSGDAGKTFKYTMENHTRVVGAAGEKVFREDRVAVPGTESRVFNLEISEDFGAGWAAVGPGLLAVVPEKLKAELIVPNSTDPFAHVRGATAFSATANGKTMYLSLGKAGLYKGSLYFPDKGGPQVAKVTLKPNSLPEGDTKTPVVISALASSRTGKVAHVIADLSSLGMKEVELFDDGKHDDGEAGDKLYAASINVPKSAKPSPKVIGVVAQDEAGKMGASEATLIVASSSEKKIVWDGDKFTARIGTWNEPRGNELCYFKAQSDEAHNGKVALELRGEGAGFIGGGVNWHGWYPAGQGTDITKYRNLCFWLKVVSANKDLLPGSIGLTLGSAVGGADNKPGATGQVQVTSYEPKALDGEWHEIIIPLKDLYGAKKADGKASDFQPTSAWQMDISTWAPLKKEFSIFIDEIGFDFRAVRAQSEWTSLPEERDATPLGDKVISVSADVDNAAAGAKISPYIYGTSFANAKEAKEMGLTTVRAGGNMVSPASWKTGFTNHGADWYYVNDGKQTPPEESWMVTFHGQWKKEGIVAYLTMPTMGRVAKDGSSVGFSIDKYPNQTMWVGKEQPSDPHPKAGNGIQFVVDEKGEKVLDDKGKPKTKLVDGDPNDCSVEMSPDEQCSMLKFMIEDMKYGTADKGGLQVIALDNEPGIWHATHRAMHPKGCGYDELWERTEAYASRLKKIDPAIKIAGYTPWGWTEYFYSGLDSQMVSDGKGTWEAPPDFVAHGKVPLGKWYLTKLAEYKKKTGVQLVDIFDWHFYPQSGIYAALADTWNKPEIMQKRVDQTRELWDPEYKTPTWMASNAGGVVRLLPLMKEWIKECNPGMSVAIGEYNFGGDQDASGGVAEAEILGVFAREGVEYAHLWGGPAVNSSLYFAFKMFRNPDGNHTAFGDTYLPASYDHKTEISVHAAKDSKTGNLTFIVINKMVEQGTKLTINLKSPVPNQDVKLFEFGRMDHHCIGQLPAKKMGGNKIELEVAPFSVLRFDLKAQ